MIFAVADKMTSNTLTQSVISRKACNCGDHSVKLWRRTRFQERCLALVRLVVRMNTDSHNVQWLTKTGE